MNKVRGKLPRKYRFGDDDDDYQPEYIIIWGFGALFVAMLIVAGMLVCR